MARLLFLVAFVLCVCSVATAAIAQLAITDDLIATINSKQSLWKAGHNERFAGLSLQTVQNMMGTTNVEHPTYSAHELERMRESAKKSLGRQIKALPEEFETGKRWPECLHAIRDQGHCGSCWAFAGSEALSDRFCIASNGTINRVLSPQDMVSCDWTNMGCNGGILPVAWLYLHESGIVDEKCFPYQSQTGEKVSCPKTCADGSDFKSRKHKASHWYHVGSILHPHLHEEAIMQELVEHGPIETGFTVYQDFISYKSGVYYHTTGGKLGGHAVKIVGYGVESGVKYWNVANSWTEKWGDNGFFRIKRGENECGFESGAYAGTPDVEHAPKL